MWYVLGIVAALAIFYAGVTIKFIYTLWKLESRIE